MAGHIPTKEKGKRSFEALSGVVYRPSSIDVIDQHHRRISDKSCVISALDDDLHTIKTYLYHAALKQGLYEETHLTALADGAKNCWSSVSVLKPHCKSLENDIGLVSHRQEVSECDQCPRRIIE